MSYYYRFYTKSIINYYMNGHVNSTDHVTKGGCSSVLSTVHIPRLLSFLSDWNELAQFKMPILHSDLGCLVHMASWPRAPQKDKPSFSDFHTSATLYIVDYVGMCLVHRFKEPRSYATSSQQWAVDLTLLFQVPVWHNHTTGSIKRHVKLTYRPLCC